jgi:uracil-xanthine permease
MEETRHFKVGEILASEGGGGSKDILELRYGVEDRPPTLPSLLFGLQHVLIMFSNMMVTPLVLGQTLDLSPELRSVLFSGALLGCGAGTIISTLGVSWIGARLPLLLGTYTVYLGPAIAIGKTQGLGAVTVAMLAGGLMLLIISPIIGRLRSLFPPVVIGTLLVVTGLSLMKIATNLALGSNTPYYGKPITIIFLLGSIVLIGFLANLQNKQIKSLSVLIAVAIVYVVSASMGLANLSMVEAAPWVRLPTFLPYGLAWPNSAGLTTILIQHLVAAIYTMSITLALCAMVGIEPSDRRVRGAVSGDGLGSVIAVMFGGVSLISYDQNVGAISLTGVASRFVVAAAGVILVLMSFFPKIGAAVGIIPPFLLGGALLFMFGMILAVGVKILSATALTQRDVLLIAISIGLSMVTNFASAAFFDTISPAVRIFAADGMVVGTFAAVFLNLALPMKASSKAINGQS